MRISNTNLPAALSFAIVGSVIAFVANAEASEPPSTTELYAMILEIREENKILRAELEKLKSNPPSVTANSLVKPADPAVIPPTVTYTYAPAATALPVTENGDQPSVTLSYEALFMGSESSGDVYTSNFDPSVANRFEFEINGADQVGLRGRTFQFSSTQTEPGYYVCCYNTPEKILFEQQYEIDVESYDIEITAEMLKKGRLEIGGSMGIRYASLEKQSNYADKNEKENLVFTNNGFGPTLSLNATYDLGFLSIVSSVRQSVELISSEFSQDIENYDDFEDISTPQIDVDALGTQTEVSLGLEFENRLSNGVQVLAGVGAEWQYWNVSGTSFDETPISCTGDCIGYSRQPNNQSLASELNLFGLTANVALRF